MSFWEKLGFKPRAAPQEIEEKLERQIVELRNRIAAEEAADSGLPDNVKNIKLGRMRRELAGLEAKRNLVWEKIRQEGEKIGKASQ
jgi:hypothetical protein